MARSLSVLSKILGLTASSNPHEAKLAEEKLEQQLQARYHQRATRTAVRYVNC